jgi:ATP-dependent Clp protease protease subunit
MLIPTVIDSATRGAFDIYSLLLKERIVYLGSAIDENMTNLVVAQLLYLDSEGHNPIMLYIHSPGGLVYGGLAIYDTMRKMKSPVATVAVGFCGSMATVLLTAGTRGQRYALPHATIHMHPTGGGAQGYTEDVRIAYKEQERLQNQTFYLIGKASGHTREEIEEMFRRDRYMNAVEAMEYGLIDEVLGETDDLIRLDDVQWKIQFQSDPKSRESIGFKQHPPLGQ